MIYILTSKNFGDIVLKYTLLTILALTFFSCRNDSDENELKWSCIQVHSSWKPTATPDCFARLKQENSPILKKYDFLPQLSAQKTIERYIVAEKR